MSRAGVPITVGDAVGRCPQGGKFQWPSKQAAKRAMKRARKRGKRGGRDLERYVYLCRCGWWHVTSEKPRAW